MEPTHSRPWDSRPELDHNLRPQRTCPSHDTIFAARVDSLLHARKDIYKQILLDELNRLRQVVVSLTATSKHHNAIPETHTPPHQLTEKSSKPPSPVTPISPQSHRIPQTSTQRNEKHFSPPVIADSPNVCSTQNSEETSYATQPLSDEQRATLPSFRSRSLPSDVPFRDPLSPACSSFEINLRRFPVLNNVVSVSRYISDVTISCSSTLLPNFTSSSISQFSGSGRQDKFESNMILGLSQPNSQSQLTSTNSIQELQKSQILRLTHRNFAPYRRRLYVPSLLARLFFEQELDLLFDSLHRLSFSAESVSHARATALYIQQLFPVHDRSHVSLPTQRRSQVEAVSSRAAIINPRANVSGNSMPSPSTSNPFPIFSKGFQCRTFYRSMTRIKELRAPAATWRDDKSFLSIQDPAALNPRQRPSHNAYAVSSDGRDLPYSINLQGVHSATECPSVTLAFGFQRRTNYPFRKTYSHARSEKSLAAPSKLVSRVSHEFASRVPIPGLTSTLLQLFQPDTHRGSFFSNTAHGSQPEVAKMQQQPSSNILYSITSDGKLCREETK